MFRLCCCWNSYCFPWNQVWQRWISFPGSIPLQFHLRLRFCWAIAQSFHPFAGTFYAKWLLAAPRVNRIKSLLNDWQKGGAITAPHIQEENAIVEELEWLKNNADRQILLHSHQFYFCPLIIFLRFSIARWICLELGGILGCSAVHPSFLYLINCNLNSSDLKTVFTIPNTIAAPSHAVKHTIGFANNRTWVCKIAAGQRACQVVYCDLFAFLSSAVFIVVIMAYRSDRKTPFSLITGPILT